MSKTKLTIDTSEERIIAAARFQAGDRVRHTLTDARGTFVETHSGFALPECWVNFDSITATSGFIPRSCNPLELEKLHVEPGVSQQLELGYDIQPTYKPIGTTSQIEKPACPDNCQDIINVDSCQDPQKWFSNQNQNLQQPIGSYINKDLVVNRLLKPTELPAALSGNCSKITATSLETKSSCLSLCSTELNTLSGSQATITPEQIKDEHTSIETSGNITTGKFQKDGMCITSTEISKTIELKIFSASRQETTQGCTSLSKNTDLNSDRDLITLEQSGDWTQGKSTHLLKLPVEQLAETEAQLRKPSKTGEGQQERIGSGYKCSNLKHSASFQELGDSTYQRENLELEQPSSLKSIPSANKFSKGTFRASLFTGMSAPLTQRKENGKLCMGGHPAKIFPAPTQVEKDSTVIDPDSGGRCLESSENPDPDSLSGKMLDLPDTRNRENLTALLPELSGALPASAMYANGQLSVQPTLARPTGGTESLLLPTPMAHSRASTEYRPPGQDKLEQKLRELGEIKSGNVSAPEFREWMMGFPTGWTEKLSEAGGQEIPDLQLSVPLDEQYATERIESPPSEIAAALNRPRSPSVESSTSIPCSDAPSERAITKDGYLDLKLICTDGGTQSRAGLNEQTIDEYAEAMDAGAQFPPVLVFYNGEEYWLADGFHRVAAAKRLEWADIAVEIRSGTRRDAVLYSVGANTAHGLRRTNADKRRAVETLLRDEEWSQWSNREIARRCGVGDQLVRQLRNSICVIHADTKLNTEHVVEIPELKAQESTERVVCRGGKTYSQDTDKIGKKTHLRVDSCQKGGVYMIHAKRDPELRRFDGEWVVAKEVNEYSITIALRREDTPVTPQFLKEVDLEYWAEIQAISDRIDRLFHCDLDPAQDAVMEVLKRRTCFTPSQIALLEFIEAQHGIFSENTIGVTQHKS